MASLSSPVGAQVPSMLFWLSASGADEGDAGVAG